MKKVFLSLAGAACILTACNNNAPATQNTASESKPETEATAPVEEAVGEAVVTINGGDDMRYDISEIRVKEGQTVKLTLNHTGKMAKDVMGHNFVLLAAGADLKAFAIEAIKAKDNDYIPASLQGEVIAHTPTIGGGESAEIEFTAPAKGSYEFLCSFPGHSAMMKGELIVE